MFRKTLIISLWNAQRVMRRWALLMRSHAPHTPILSLCPCPQNEASAVCSCNLSSGRKLPFSWGSLFKRRIMLRWVSRGKRYNMTLGHSSRKDGAVAGPNDLQNGNSYPGMMVAFVADWSCCSGAVTLFCSVQDRVDSPGHSFQGQQKWCNGEINGKDLTGPGM